MLTTKNFKTHLNSNLDIITDTGYGGHVGNNFCRAPTDVNGMALLASKCQDQQPQLLIAALYVCNERYTIHPDKTKIIKLGTTKANNTSLIDLSINDTTLQLSDSCMHSEFRKVSLFTIYPQYAMPSSRKG